MKIGVFVTAFGLSLAVAAGADAASLVVVETSDPAVPAGQVVAEGASISVAPGARIMLVSESGATLTLSGPYTGVPSLPGGGGAADPSLISSLSSLLSSGGQQTSSLGTMKEVSGLVDRSILPEAKPEPTNPWAIDIGRSDTACVPGDRPGALWRTDASQPLTLRLENELSGQSAEVSWPAGASETDWPAALPPIDGGGYMLPSAGGANRIEVRVVPAGLPSEAHRIAWMAENGCARQARLLVSHLR